MELYDVIKRQLLTEKVKFLEEGLNTYVFEVLVDANKSKIKKTVESLFGVKVTDINTMIMQGKTGRVGKHTRRYPKWKKAIVTLKDGDKIDLFDNA